MANKKSSPQQRKKRIAELEAEIDGLQREAPALGAVPRPLPAAIAKAARTCIKTLRSVHLPLRTSSWFSLRRSDLLLVFLDPTRCARRRRSPHRRREWRQSTGRSG